MFKRVVIHFRVILHFMVILMPFIVILQHFKFPYLSFLDNLGNLRITRKYIKITIKCFKITIKCIKMTIKCTIKCTIKYINITTKNPAARKELPGEMPETQVAIDVSKEPEHQTTNELFYLPVHSGTQDIPLSVSYQSHLEAERRLKISQANKVCRWPRLASRFPQSS
eukprot:GHVP01023824.1.p1 GENE.GHVP01023824.1~~GHVP01023824.1.p1  ORF type:complete len:168 (-),score=5.79 GHVP01023824.1:41-544(-)